MVPFQCPEHGARHNMKQRGASDPSIDDTEFSSRQRSLIEVAVRVVGLNVLDLAFIGQWEFTTAAGRVAAHNNSDSSFDVTLATCTKKSHARHLRSRFVVMQQEGMNVGSWTTSRIRSMKGNSFEAGSSVHATRPERRVRDD